MDVCVYHHQYCLISNHRVTIFDGTAIEKICINDEITALSVHYRNGEIAHWPCKWLSSYIFQFGIAVSKDGSYVFIQTWESGLFCLSSQTGEVIWRTESKRGITNIFVNDTNVLAHQHDRALQLLDIHTGKVLKEKRPATAWGFTSLDHGHIICQVTARRWEIINAQTLEVAETFTHKDFTNGHTDYCIRDIALTDDGRIQVSGFKNIWDTSVSPAIQLPNLEFTHFIKAKTFEKP